MFIRGCMERKWERLLMGLEISLGGDNSVLELDNGNDCTDVWAWIL